jgi:hypothetical protein
MVLSLYDRFGLHGFTKQKEIEKVKELESVLTKKKYFLLSFNTSKKSSNFTFLNNIFYNNSKIILIKKELLEKIYCDLSEIYLHPFFSEKIYKECSVDHYHFSKYDKFIFDKSENNFLLINDNNIFPQELTDINNINSIDYRIIDMKFFKNIKKTLMLISKKNI